METQFGDQLQTEFSRYGFKLTSKQIEQLAMYRNELLRWNKHINLTALHDDTEIIHKHFLDSVSVLEHCFIEDGHTVIDIGTGAGFPGVALKIYIPNIRLTLVETSQKKGAFLRYLISQLGFDSAVQIHTIRAEIYAENQQNKNTYDWVVTRYVASLGKSVEYCLPLLNGTGRWIAYKSNQTDIEIHENKKTIKKYGGEIEAIHNSSITSLNRCYVVVRRLDGKT